MLGNREETQNKGQVLLLTWDYSRVTSASGAKTATENQPLSFEEPEDRVQSKHSCWNLKVKCQKGQG